MSHTLDDAGISGNVCLIFYQGIFSDGSSISHMEIQDPHTMIMSTHATSRDK